MRRLWLRIAPVLKLARVTSAFAAVGNVWFVILWTRGMGEREPGTPELHGPLWLLLGGGALLALGLYAFGASLNDILDARRDRTLRPDRPIPAGRVSQEGAFALVVCTLLAGVLGATVFGRSAVVLTLILSAAILLFNITGRFIPGVGLVVLGLIYAGHMMIPNVNLVFVWPVWLVMTHALAVGAVSHVMARKVPRLSKRAALAAFIGWAFWSAVLLGAAGVRPENPWPRWVPIGAAVWVGLVAGLFVLIVWRRVLQHGAGPRAADKIARYGSLWLVLYACVWLLGADLLREALLLMALAAAGFIGMGLLREIHGLVEQPVGYRR